MTFSALLVGARRLQYLPRHPLSVVRMYVNLNLFLQFLDRMMKLSECTWDPNHGKKCCRWNFDFVPRLGVRAKGGKFLNICFSRQKLKKGQNFKTFVFQDRSFKFTQDADFQALISYLLTNFGFGFRFWAPAPKRVKI